MLFVLKSEVNKAQFQQSHTQMTKDDVAIISCYVTNNQLQIMRDSSYSRSAFTTKQLTKQKDNNVENDLETES